MGQVTIAVVGQAADYLTSHRVKDSILVKPDGSPLTIGDVKSRINLWLAERGVENPHETIFAIGHDAGVPHSVGDPEAAMRLGQTIVFDIFPCEAGGGYFYDFTRTWCLGYAPDEVQKLYDDVLAVYHQVVSELRPGALCRTYQELTCDLFQQRGHLSQRDDPQIQQGYTHSLGHGVGLNLHERPAFRLSSPETEILKNGTVITVEPGLYYPEKGMGVRLEDTFYLRPDGIFEIFAPYPLDLVLPVK
jgi:Xaa-Pro aminopeptidase